MLVCYVFEMFEYLEVLVSILHVDLKEEVSFLLDVDEIFEEDLPEDQL